MDILFIACKGIGAILVLAGIFFFISGTVGVIRMPDPYNMGHVAGKCDGPGFMLTILGVWFYWVTIHPVESIKLLVLILVVVFANPIVIHAILRMCYRTGVKSVEGTTELKLEDTGGDK